MLRAFRFRAVGKRTALYAVVGPDAVQSPAPVLLNAAFDASGLDAVAVPLQTADVARFAEAFGVAGAADDAQFGAGALDELVRETEQQFERWTGQRPGAGVMHETAVTETGHRATEAQRP
jgi:hypothetical protein